MSPIVIFTQKTRQPHAPDVFAKRSRRSNSKTQNKEKDRYPLQSNILLTTSKQSIATWPPNYRIPLKQITILCNIICNIISWINIPSVTTIIISLDKCHECTYGWKLCFIALNCLVAEIQVFKNLFQTQALGLSGRVINPVLRGGGVVPCFGEIFFSKV